MFLLTEWCEEAYSGAWAPPVTAVAASQRPLVATCLTAPARATGCAEQGAMDRPPGSAAIGINLAGRRLRADCSSSSSKSGNKLQALASCCILPRTASTESDSVKCSTQSASLSPTEQSFMFAVAASTALSTASGDTDRQPVHTPQLHPIATPPIEDHGQEQCQLRVQSGRACPEQEETEEIGLTHSREARLSSGDGWGESVDGSVQGGPVCEGQRRPSFSLNISDVGDEEQPARTAHAHSTACCSSLQRSVRGRQSGQGASACIAARADQHH
jgi:hypothetical protein